jgi:hypothetical protein
MPVQVFIVCADGIFSQDLSQLCDSLRGVLVRRVTNVVIGAPTLSISLLFAYCGPEFRSQGSRSR